MGNDLGALTARRDSIIQQQQANNSAITTNNGNIATNGQNITTNTQSLGNAQQNVTTLSGQIDTKNNVKSGVAQEINTLQSQLSNISDDENAQREIQGQIDAKELDMQSLEQEIGQLTTDKTQQESEVETLTNEKGTLETEKTDLENSAAELDEKATDYEKALQEVDTEIEIFKNVYENANGNADDITPETIDKAFTDLENSVLSKGAEMTNETKNKDGSIVREYSDGTTLFYTPGKEVEYYKDTTNGFMAGGFIRTSEGNDFQEDNMFFTLTDNKEEELSDGTKRLRDTGFSGGYDYSSQGDRNSSTTFSQKNIITSLNGEAHVRSRSLLNMHENH